MHGAALFSEIGPAEFRARAQELTAVYGAAMDPDPGQLPGRRAIMERHAANPDFRALVVTASPGGPAIAFCYGFRGTAGQWWHDVVASALTAASGQQFAAAWLANVLEVAEVHVQPDHQGRGIGRSMLLALTAGRGERTAVLSTRDADTAARRLYRGLGFADLLTGFCFPGGGPPYAVMGAMLPLRDVAGPGAPGAGQPGPGPPAAAG